MKLEHLNILEHYKNPKNFGRPSWKIDIESTAINSTCGDEITFYIKIKKNKIEKVAFEGSGCSIAIASASMLSEFLLGKQIDKLENLAEFILSELSMELSFKRENCALLCVQAINKALTEIK